MTVPAVVLGDMDLIRPLGLAGIPAVAAGHSGPETAWSKFATGSLAMPDNLWEEPEAGVDALIGYARTVDAKPVLFYQKESALAMVSRHREELSEHFRFVVGAPDLVEDMIDKSRFQQRARDLGLPVPRAEFAVVGRDPVPIDLRFPVVLKPASLRDRSPETFLRVTGGRKALELGTQADLDSMWAHADLAGMLLGVQEYVPGGEASLVSHHAYVDAGRVVGEFTGRKIRTHPPESGLSTAVLIEDIPEVRTLGRSVLEALGLEGVAKIDMKFGPDGSLHILEVNPRFNLWHHPGAVAGVNLPALVHRRLTEGVVQPSPPARDGVTWIQVWGDWSAAREAGVSPSDWIAEVRAAEARRAAHLSDPGSMLGALAFAGIKAGRGALASLGRATRQSGPL